MSVNILPDKKMIALGWKGLCPQCHEHSIFKPGFTLELQDKCVCGLDLSKNDSADGPAVFMIFILGFSLVPLAIWLEYTMYPPLWAHAILWTIVTVFLTVVMLRPLKAYIIALQYKHRPNDWK